MKFKRQYTVNLKQMVCKSSFIGEQRGGGPKDTRQNTIKIGSVAQFASIDNEQLTLSSQNLAEILAYFMEFSKEVRKYDLAKNSANFQRHHQGEFEAVGFLYASAASRQFAMATPIRGGFDSTGIKTPRPWFAGLQ